MISSAGVGFFPICHGALRTGRAEHMAINDVCIALISECMFVSVYFHTEQESIWQSGERERQ